MEIVVGIQAQVSCNVASGQPHGSILPIGTEPTDLQHSQPSGLITRRGRGRMVLSPVNLDRDLA